MSVFNSEEKETQEMIKNLKSTNTTYLYDKYEEDYDWIKVNVNHINYTLTRNRLKLYNYNYTIDMLINDIPVLLNTNVSEIVKYFMKNKYEYKNNVKKIVEIKYNFTEI